MASPRRRSAKRAWSRVRPTTAPRLISGMRPTGRPPGPPLATVTSCRAAARGLVPRSPSPPSPPARVELVQLEGRGRGGVAQHRGQLDGRARLEGPVVGALAEPVLEGPGADRHPGGEADQEMLGRAVAVADDVLHRGPDLPQAP